MNQRFAGYTQGQKEVMIMVYKERIEENKQYLYNAPNENQWIYQDRIKTLKEWIGQLS